MQHTASLPTLRKQPPQAAKPAFSVVAIHDGFFSGVRAMEALEWLKHTLYPDLQLYPASWSFDKLALQNVRTTSIRAAAAADLLIVSADDDSPVPHHIRQWFEPVHAQQMDTRPMLVALYKDDLAFNSTRGQLCTHLKRVAASWQTEFMCNDDFDQRLNRDFATQLISSKNTFSGWQAKPFGGEFQSAPRHWGING